jgi:hypothetical protein
MGNCLYAFVVKQALISAGWNVADGITFQAFGGMFLWPKAQWIELGQVPFECIYEFYMCFSRHCAICCGNHGHPEISIFVGGTPSMFATVLFLWPLTCLDIVIFGRGASWSGIWVWIVLLICWGSVSLNYMFILTVWRHKMDICTHIIQSWSLI